MSQTVIRLRPMLLAAGICALLTLPVTLAYGPLVSGDGLSYIDLAADAAQSGPWPLLSNAYWSPAYPAILAVALKILHPGPASELVVVRAVDWLICVFTYACFTYFLYNLACWLKHLWHPAFLAFAYSLLLVANLDVTLWIVGPHILMEGMIYLIAGICLQRRYVALGIVLGLAYIVKAALFPLSIALLAILFFRERKGALIAAAAFALTAAPLVATLSYTKTRFTFGDVGHLAYARFVNNLPYFWEGPLPASVTLRHGPETVSANPVILKFDGPGTWPLWYDPSYWYEGIPTHFDLRQQIRVLLRSIGVVARSPNSDDLLDLARFSLPMIAGLAVIAFLGLRVRSLYAVIKDHLWLILWPAFAIFTFACVLVHYRYVFPFAVLGWTALFAASRPTSRIALGVAAGLLLMAAPEYARQMVHLVRSQRANMMETVSKLHSLGIRPGDELASLEFPYKSGYLVRLAGARVTQMIVAAPPAMSKLPANDVRQVLATLRANGAKALLSYFGPAFDNDSGWVRVRDDIYVRMLQ